jgi:membrane carboxypeptidase/penicillin-binding protein
MTRAYGVFAAGGILNPTNLLVEVRDRTGKVLFEINKDRAHRAKRVLPEQHAFIMAHMMKGVVQRGTARQLLALNRPVAGKTGTTNDQMDAWFIGYTPRYACGVWVGFDNKKEIGPKETGGRVSGPIWLKFMSEYLDHREQLTYGLKLIEAKKEAQELGIAFQPPQSSSAEDFPVPEGVEPYFVDRHTGAETTKSNPNAILEYFVSGTKPQGGYEVGAEDITSYLEG